MTDPEEQVNPEELKQALGFPQMSDEDLEHLVGARGEQRRVVVDGGICF